MLRLALSFQSEYAALYRAGLVLLNNIRGIEATIEADPGQEPPTGRIAFCLLVGFTVMLIIEQLLAPNAHSHSMDGIIPMSKTRIPDSVSSVEFDAELGDMNYHSHTAESHRPLSSPMLDGSASKQTAFPLLLGLVIHGSADGLALGVANISKTVTGTTSAISVVVFLALILHKGKRWLLSYTKLLIYI